MGFSGPIPNRSDDYSRARDANKGDRVPVTKGTALPPVIPEPDEDWHPIARQLWDSFEGSGQTHYWQSSDWAYAYSVMDDLTHYKYAERRSAMMLSALDSAFARLLVTEGDRRRVRLELDHPEDDETSVGDAAVADYRKRLGVIQGGKSA